MSFLYRIPRRIAVGIAALSAILLAVDYWLDVVTGQHIDAARAVRKATSEQIARDIVPYLQNGDVKALGQSLDSRLTDDPSIRSVGVRKSSGQMHAETQSHREDWRDLENGKSTTTHVQVPIYAGRDVWGYVEVSYQPSTPSLVEWVMQPKIIALYATMFMGLGLCLIAPGPSRGAQDRDG
jgi:uncharacterized membrane protein affecting hemolysin expression